MKKKVALTITSIALVAAMAIGGTLAWLTNQSETVTNTFIASKGITALKLDESEYKDGALVANSSVQANSYTMIPGETYPKDPKVTVTTEVDSYVFVEVTAGNNVEEYLEYAIGDGWVKVNGTENVYAQNVDKSDTSGTLYILKGGDIGTNGQVTVKDADFTKITEGQDPTLTFKAYAIQTAGFGTIEEAWTAVNEAYAANQA